MGFSCIFPFAAFMRDMFACILSIRPIRTSPLELGLPRVFAPLAFFCECAEIDPQVGNNADVSRRQSLDEPMLPLMLILFLLGMKSVSKAV